jgi:hypothetical protein
MKHAFIILIGLTCLNYALPLELDNLPAGATDLYFKPRFSSSRSETYFDLKQPKNHVLSQEKGTLLDLKIERIKQQAIVDALEQFIKLPPEQQKQTLEMQKQLLQLMQNNISDEDK